MNQTEFEKTKLQQISDVAWLVHQGSERLGILSQGEQERFTYITGKDMITLQGEAAVRKHFGNVTLFEEKISEPMQRPDGVYVHGHLIDYPEPFVIEPGHTDYNPDVPLFSKNAGSNIYYAAGFYVINFSKGWKWANSPKWSTLTDYGFEGPFRSEIDAKHRMKQLNRERKKNANE
jgi:hypothetical protein